uniref:Uncharacterized protein n=1 Tax=Anopheles culicifacies TaxID=139723 RepID=A0A182M0B3_9DIPT
MIHHVGPAWMNGVDYALFNLPRTIRYSCKLFTGMCLKPLVRRERVRVDGQYVEIMVPHPGDAVLGQIFYPAGKECRFTFPHGYVAGNAQVEVRFRPLSFGRSSANSRDGAACRELHSEV